jgi:hypothetical protein
MWVAEKGAQLKGFLDRWNRHSEIFKGVSRFGRWFLSRESGFKLFDSILKFSRFSVVFVVDENEDKGENCKAREEKPRRKVA